MFLFGKSVCTVQIGLQVIIYYNLNNLGSMYFPGKKVKHPKDNFYFVQDQIIKLTLYGLCE